MKMDFDTFMGDIYQKDVNNYFLVDRETGAVKAKGAYVKKLSDLDYDLPIVNRAISEYFAKTRPILIMWAGFSFFNFKIGGF